ncbi:tRNA 5-methylaminomethyl-2-thiouridine biosynthesis bifunctional protein MnmC [Poriferisphaera corsica]|uniref:tRNA 5-methylaminomethyl-2-thiouridine biosynthesis bifunctional protein MnmC n=1 Tax=Poriferisphaera corsica TaxID=2528020 RepID=A0A517YYG1_9BACT|nr:bifunctional tRNA (5-methylaminomethyl-2-thiouridine)(34)-methyltransferase MnmD/FAD-dependent 5-carboxymethylaminomethyl-2-thiouridine(34) oxidoreductase MnmC [Poriferisphaera corsica]QDU35259.1 tRNA 5-methylaminomethyl-2-thiouridine biosynthesis bifunctional protein MnmC [Poriferisphaera corsica]
MSGIEKPKLTWGEDGVLRSELFEDVYFSVEGGAEETRYVFLEGNGLPERFTEKKKFVIAETGFGTGLNFLVTWKMWQEAKQHGEVDEDAVLEYVSFEKYPLSLDEIKQALGLFDEFKNDLEWFDIYYPEVLMRGVHKIQWIDGVVLTLVLGDINEMISEMRFKADAWYLDGFSPSQNKGMWTEHVFDWIGKLTAPKGTVATFTAAGFVRRGLIGAGFEMKKVKGFGKKREMLVGAYCGAGVIEDGKPWFDIRAPKIKPKRGLVIGGGIAGCAAAWSLAERGVTVDLLERNTIASGGSSNLAGLFQPHLSVEWSEQALWVNTANQYVMQWLDQYAIPNDVPMYDQCGVFHPAINERDEKRFRKIIEADHWLHGDAVRWVEEGKGGWKRPEKCTYGGLMVDAGGWVKPNELCEMLLNHKGIAVFEKHEVQRLIRTDDEKWAINNDWDTTYDVVVIANAIDAKRFDVLNCLPLRVVRGQLSMIEGNSGLTYAVSGDCYILPKIDGKSVVGATFGPDDFDMDVREQDHEKIMTDLKMVLPKAWERLKDKPWKGKVGFRCVGEDRLPMVGCVPDITFYERAYQDLKDGKVGKQYEKGRYLPGLYVNLAHGSRGLVSGLLGGELIAAIAHDEILPVEKCVADAVNPARFVIRKIKRGLV